MKTLECGGCGGVVVPSFYREPRADETDPTPRRVYYECPLCGPGVQEVTAASESPTPQVSIATA